MPHDKAPGDLRKPGGGAPSGHARRWVQSQLLTESLRAQMAEEEPRQLTVRLNPVVAALFESVAARLGVSKNNAANLLLGSALIDAVSAFPEEGREALRKDLEKQLGRRLDLTPPPEPKVPGVLTGVVDDLGMRGVVEGIKSLFR